MRIFFDLDGPLLDVSDRYYRVFSDICKGELRLSKDKFWNLKRKKTPWLEIFKQAKVSIGEREFLKLWVKNIELKKYLTLDKVHIFAKKNLFALSKKHSLYLISLRQSKLNLFWQVRSLNLDKYFKKIIHCKHSFKDPWKEKAKLIKKNINFNEPVFVIGDTEVDLRAAKLAKVKSIAVASGIRTKSLLVKENPEFLILKINEISKIIS